MTTYQLTYKMSENKRSNLIKILKEAKGHKKSNHYIGVWEEDINKWIKFFKDEHTQELASWNNFGK